MFASQSYASLILALALLLLCSPVVHGDTQTLGYKGQLVYTSATGKPYVNYLMESDHPVTAAMMEWSDYQVWKESGFEGAYKRISECDCGDATLKCEKSCFLNPLKTYVLSFTNYDVSVPATVQFTDKGVGSAAFTIEDSSSKSLSISTSGGCSTRVSGLLLVGVVVGLVFSTSSSM